MALVVAGAVVGGSLALAGGATALGIAGAAGAGALAGGVLSKAGKNAAGGAAGTAAQNAEFQYDIANREVELAEKQYTDQKALSDEFLPLFRQQVQTAMTQQGKDSARSDEQWSIYTNDFRPAEQKLVETALSYASPGRQEQAAQRAAADTAAAFGTQRAATTEALTRAGEDASTIATLNAAGRLEEAKATGGVMDTARRSVEQQGISLVDNAARFGRNMPSTGLQTSTAAINAGTAAQGAAEAGLGVVAAPLQSTLPALNSASANAGASTNSAIAGGYLGLAGQKASNDIFGDMLGAGVKAYGMGLFGSSEKIKDIHGDVDMTLEDAAEVMEQAPAKSYTYIGGTEQRIGPTAEAMQQVTGKGDGMTIDPANMLGLHQAVLGTLVREVQALKGGARPSREISLEDY